jgi:hypothetical protein
VSATETGSVALRRPQMGQTGYEFQPKLGRIARKVTGQVTAGRPGASVHVRCGRVAAAADAIGCDVGATNTPAPCSAPH